MFNNKIFTLCVPKFYCFYDAMKVIQKGKNDPLNLIKNGEFIRLVNINENNIIIRVCKKEEKLCVKIINDVYSSDVFTKLPIMITKLFGLDDPLLHNTLDFGFWYDKNLNYLVTVHGYLSVFEAMIQTVIGQLIHANVANLLREKFIRKFGNCIVYNQEKYLSFPIPSLFEGISIEQIQEIGISKLKSQAILNIAREFTENNLEDSLINTESPNKIKEILTNLYGVGIWTSDWISLRALRKFEVVPAGDLIIRKAFSWCFNQNYILSSKDVSLITKNFYPYGGALAYRIMYIYNKRDSQGTFKPNSD